MIWYAPLFNFWSECEHYHFQNYLRIENRTCPISDVIRSQFLSESEIRDIEACTFVVVVKERKSKYLAISTVMNTLLTSFWVFTPNQLHYRFRFSEQDDMRRYLDRFQYNSVEDHQDNFTEDDLHAIREFHRGFMTVIRKNARLQTALVNTFRGCVAYDWRVSFVLYAAALEAMLTYKRGFGTTKRLAKAYALLTESTSYARTTAARRFERLYNIRSEIMHGRKFKTRSNTNLHNLSKMESLVRNLWQRILCDQVIMAHLEKSDAERNFYFKSL